MYIFDRILHKNDYNGIAAKGLNLYSNMAD